MVGSTSYSSEHVYFCHLYDVYAVHDMTLPYTSSCNATYSNYYNMILCPLDLVLPLALAQVQISLKRVLRLPLLDLLMRYKRSSFAAIWTNKS